MTTTAPTTLATSLAPTTAVPDENITVDPIEIVLSYYFIGSYYTPLIIYGFPTVYKLQPININLSIYGENDNVGVLTSAVDITISIHGEFITGVSLDGLIINITIDIISFGTASENGADLSGSQLIPSLTIDYGRVQFVKWSKIGSLDFTIDETNMAGEMPMERIGWIYGLKKLRNTVVVYGQNCIVIMRPVGLFYSIETVYEMGLISTRAFCGSDHVHYFVNVYGQLHRLTSDGIENLDYSEFLINTFNNFNSKLVMSYDVERDLIFMCDGTYGYVYSVKAQSLGECPPNITAMYDYSGRKYVFGAGDILPMNAELQTDIFDFGTRKPKTIRSIELGTNVEDHLYVSIDYRTSYRHDFVQIGWFKVNPSGKVFPTCYGVEFKIRIKNIVYEPFEIDYMKIRGNIHGFSYLDTVRKEY
jgi:hypothetical protein